MKKNDFGQIKGLDIKELMIKIAAIKAEMPDLMLDKNMNKLKDLKIISKKRKDLAQISTVLRQKELLLEIESRVKSLESSEGREVARVKSQESNEKKVKSKKGEAKNVIKKSKAKTGKEKLVTKP